MLKPDSYVCVRNEGMPVHGRPFDKGNLYIHFNVVFPETLTAPQVRAPVLRHAVLCWDCTCAVLLLRCARCVAAAFI